MVLKCFVNDRRGWSIIWQKKEQTALASGFLLSLSLILGICTPPVKLNNSIMSEHRQFELCAFYSVSAKLSRQNAISSMKLFLSSAPLLVG